MTNLSTLSAAIEWFRSAHDPDRLVPSRLHRHDTEGELGAPPYTGAFMAYLHSQPGDIVEVRETVDCDHLHDSTWPKCAVERAYYRAPMWRALQRLSKQQPLRPHRPTPFALVVTLMDSGYDWRLAATRLRLTADIGEALMLMALRSLHGKYERGPIPRPAWTQLSESAQNAIMAQEVSA